MQHGWSQVEGRNSYFHSITGVYIPEFVEIDEKILSDSMQCSLYRRKNIADSWYYFSEEKNGEMAVGWTIHHGNQYYYSNEGKMQYSFQV